jgi:putative endonuclease
MVSLIYRLADLLRHRARRRQWDRDLASGRRGEDLAHRFLRKRGFTIVARNYRSPAGTGEIDLVAWDRDTLVFAEVKSRSSADFGTPDRAVDREKEGNLIRVARDYARRAGVEWERVRFDIINVLLTNPPQIDLVRDAFRRKRTL